MAADPRTGRSFGIPGLRWRRHAVFLAVLLAAVILRALVQVRYAPAYVVDASSAYPEPRDGLAALATGHHALGLATGVVVYVLLLRWAVWRWLAALAAAPLLLDPRMVAVEHASLPDASFGCAVAVAVLALSWRSGPAVVEASLGGVVLGVAAAVRPAGTALVVAAAAFALLAAAPGRRRLAGAVAVLLGFGLVFAPHLLWRSQGNGQYLSTAGLADGRSIADEVGQALPTLVQQGGVPVPLLLCGLLVGLVAGLGAGRAGASGMRAVCLLTSAVPVVMLLAAVGAVGAADLSWRDFMPTLVWGPVAGVLGATALMRGRRSVAAGRPQVDDVDEAALDDFRARHGKPMLAPVVVVIAAYNEGVGLPRVLSAMPSTVCGLPTDVVVVDDGSTDETATAVRDHARAYLVSCPANRGQGAAMRLGYRVAREHGADYIITTDADAQYDAADFPVVLAPLLDGSADFVTGSRRLGRQHTLDRFRRTGVYVFAWVVTGLTGQKVTDTSFGLRAMRAEVTAEVTLNQPQYQSAELLIGVQSHGYRITEVPATMHQRAAGSTKKGGNLVYGARYARVVLGTWWREGCPSPAPHSAPATRTLQGRSTAPGPARR